MNTYTERRIYEGHPVLDIRYLNKDDEERTLVSFGKNKARAICEHIDEIRVFAEEGE
jgi:hypothetical protein